MTDPISRARDIFLAALEREGRERLAYVDGACGTDVELRQEVRKLLEGYERASGTGGDESGAIWTGSTAVQLGEFVAGSMLGNYKLVHLWGEGGMGTVYLAEQKEPVQRRVAVKIIKAGMDSPSAVARFEAERQAMALMDHPNIAKILDGGTTQAGKPYFVMELVRGLPITKYCDQERLTPRERISLFAPVCDAVFHAHQKGIIHRDLKPSNILVGLHDGKPVPKIIDFGVAKATGLRLSKKTIYTEIGNLVGTLEYMSPEQADLNNLDIDTRADVYTLGVILYELLTGSVPFKRQDIAEAGIVQMLMMIKEKEPQKPSTRISAQKEIPSIAASRRSDPASLHNLLMGELDWIIMKCLEKDRNRRYSSPQLLAADLQRFLSDEPVQAAPPSRLYRVKKFLRRHRGQAAAAGLFVLVLLGAVAATSIGWWQAIQARQLAQEMEEKAKQEAAIHRALLEHLQEDLFGQIDPELRRSSELPINTNISGRTLLDRAARLIGKRFEEAPMTQAALRRMLGNAFSSLGAHAQAQEQFEIARALVAPSEPLALEIKEAMGVALHNAGRMQEGHRLLVEAVQAREQAHGPLDARTMRARYELGSVERSLERLPEAEWRLTRLLADQKAVLGEHDPSVPRTMSALADICMRGKREEAAEKWHRDALALCSQSLSADHPQIQAIKNDLAYLLLSQKRLGQAQKLLDEVVESAGRTLERDDPLLLLFRNNQAGCLWERGKADEAEKIYGEVLESGLRITTPENRFLLGVKRRMAVVAFGKNDWPKAVARYAEIAPAITREYGTEHSYTWEVLENLAYACSKVQKWEQSIATAEELLKYLDEAKKKVKSDHYFRVLYTAHQVLGQLKQRDRAAALLQRGLQVIPKDSPEYGRVERMLVGLQQ